MSVIFDDAAKLRLETYLATHVLSDGVGTTQSACSVAAINLALTGVLSDDTPDCSSPVTCAWVRVAQDAMPAAIRNSARWKAAVVRLAGCGRAPADEVRRLAAVMEWMWVVVLPSLQCVADAGGYGPQWAAMCRDRTRAAALAAARDAAYAAADAARAAWERFSPCELLESLAAMEAVG